MLHQIHREWVVYWQLGFYSVATWAKVILILIYVAYTIAFILTLRVFSIYLAKRVHPTPNQQPRGFEVISGTKINNPD